MSNTLLPCPFCGGEAIVVKTERCGRYIGCWDCGGRTEEFETDYAGSARDKAIAAWNRRAQQENSMKYGRIVWFEEQHGTPIDGYDCDWGWKCSICGYEYPDSYDDPENPPTNNFCPNCGAKMGMKALFNGWLAFREKPKEDL